jgi:5-methylcytosine-specific restriction protein A
MPRRPRRTCSTPGCRTLTETGRCELHTEQQRSYDRERGSAHARGYTRRWTSARNAFLITNPWCFECARRNRHEPATCVDHIIPHRGDHDLFWDEANWQPLCTSCHSEKTAREDGGFGNATRGAGTADRRGDAAVSADAPRGRKSLPGLEEDRAPLDLSRPQVLTGGGSSPTRHRRPV